MIGFNYKNLFLQLIHGSLLLGSFCVWNYGATQVGGFFSQNSTFALGVGLFAAFIVGVFVDYIADWSEAIIVGRIIKPPVYYLLSNPRHFGIALAHRQYVKDELCRLADQYDSPAENEKRKFKSYKEVFDKKSKLSGCQQKKMINYLLQVAKNKAFRIGTPNQKEQMDSFFMLYIFSRNLALSLSASCFFIMTAKVTIFWLMPAASIVALMAAHRYYLYYCRILLGSTIDDLFKEKTENRCWRFESDEYPSRKKNTATEFH